MFIHIVKSGETILGIAESYQVIVENFLADNGLNTNSRAVVGQALIIQQPEIVHTVQSGESLNQISQNYNVGLLTLLRNNFFLRGKTTVNPGQQIVIRYRDENKTKSFLTNSYAYTFINPDLLREQLPYLTYMTPFSYGIQSTGQLVYLPDDQWIIDMSREYDVSPLMHLSTLTETGTFSNDRANLIFSDQEKQNLLIDEIVRNMQNKGYEGLDIDFEFIYPEDKFDYIMFLQNVYRTINPLGYPLFSALAPKISDTQRGTLYEGHDYGGIGSSVDMVLLMTYEWGYTYGPPMAVAPINQVEEVIKYGLTRISSSKILMGIPTYGYDWTLPFERGVTKAISLSPVECIRLAERYNSEIQFDNLAQSPWFNYADENGRLHEVWFEDARSIQAKLKLAENYDLAGLGYWNSMREFPQNWVVLNSNYNIINV